MVRNVRFLSVLCMFVGLAWLVAGLAQAQDANPGEVQVKNSPVQSPAANQAPSDDPFGGGQQIVQGAGPAPQIAAPQPFTSKDGKRKGWKVTIPGNHALATPAIVDGKLFIGGGFGSHEFYAFDPKTGKMLWQYRTSDDGPTAAVVAEGYVAFNTESCELEILTPDGKSVWKKWLGDPLMSMPAIAMGRLYMAYPNSKGDHKHYLACFELKTGKQLWQQPIAGEIITAPLVEDGQVYLATLEGTVYCFSATRWQARLVGAEERHLRAGRLGKAVLFQPPGGNEDPTGRQDGIPAERAIGRAGDGEDREGPGFEGDRPQGRLPGLCQARGFDEGGGQSGCRQRSRLRRFHEGRCQDGSGDV